MSKHSAPWSHQSYKFFANCNAKPPATKATTKAMAIWLSVIAPDSAIDKDVGSNPGAYGRSGVIIIVGAERGATAFGSTTGAALAPLRKARVFALKPPGINASRASADTSKPLATRARHRNTRTRPRKCNMNTRTTYLQAHVEINHEMG